MNKQKEPSRIESEKIEFHPLECDLDFTLLIVEDDEDDYLLVSEYVEDIFDKVNVVWVQTHAEAREAFLKCEHDLCFLDVNLAGESGVDLLDFAREHAINIPIVMLTGMNDQRTDLLAARKGAVDYIVKDEMNRSQIARCIRYALTRKQASDERLERTRVESESEAKTRFLANLSHELRSPLSAILGFSELLMDAELDSTALDSVHIIHRNGLHLLSLLDDVMDIAKIEAGRMEIESQEVNFEKFLRTVSKSLAISAQKKGLRLQFHIQEKLPDRIHTDLTRLRQVLINVINNAIKYTATGGIDVQVRFRESSSQQSLHFSVRDSGRGIEQDELEHIFKPFSQLDDPTMHREGAGLGLSICKQIVGSMGGDITCESLPSKGSTFNFWVQIGLPENAEVRRLNLHKVEKVPGLAIADEQSSLLEDRYVLIADDLPDVRNFMRRFVARMGAKPMLARNGLEAVEIARRNDRIAAAFIDLQMPVMNGFQAAEKIRSIRPDLALFAMTASSDVNAQKLAMHSGFDEAFAKPLNFKQLSEILSNALGENSKPVLADSKAARGKAEIDPFVNDDASSGLRVLIVDDDRDLATVCAKVSVLLGCEADTAGSVEAALAKMAELSYDLLLLDKNLGDASASDLIAKLDMHSSNPRIWIMSGEDAGDELLQNALVDGALLKPVSKSVLEETYSRYAKRA